MKTVFTLTYIQQWDIMKVGLKFAKIMNKITKTIRHVKNIIEAWGNVIITDEEFEPLFQSRLKMCQDCDNNIAGVCKLCGCPVVSKSHSRGIEEDGFLINCPDNLWLPILRQDTSGNYILRSEIPDNLKHYFTEEVIDYKDWVKIVGKEEE